MTIPKHSRWSSKAASRSALAALPLAFAWLLAACSSDSSKKTELPAGSDPSSEGEMGTPPEADAPDAPDAPGDDAAPAPLGGLYLAGGDPEPATLHRLTRSELMHSLQDLLGADVPIGELEPDVLVGGFASIGASSVSVSPAGVGLHEQQVLDATGYVFADQARASALLPCLPADAGLDSGATTIYVTHDQEEAMSLADRVVVMSKGRIRQVGTPAEVYDCPADLFVATFVGSPGMNFIRCQVAGIDGELQLLSEQGQLRLDVPLELAPRAPTTPSATLGIRCEHLHEDERGPIVGRVLTEEYLGSARMVHVDTPCGRLVMRSDASTPRALGSELRLRLDASQASVFDAATEARL